MTDKIHLKETATLVFEVDTNTPLEFTYHVNSNALSSFTVEIQDGEASIVVSSTEGQSQSLSKITIDILDNINTSEDHIPYTVSESDAELSPSKHINIRGTFPVAGKNYATTFPALPRTHGQETALCDDSIGIKGVRFTNIDPQNIMHVMRKALQTAFMHGAISEEEGNFTIEKLETDLGSRFDITERKITPPLPDEVPEVA